ncbi:unnamed protein product [Penicillium salamii]|uniref:HBS1-like protein N-terminal domain-containing protein n=1 Tax=Penicillium salamii TaxID=1612424 RepID=A0A9W4J0J1_9EURO|nr:unnamed protein product [Penicillium salamii]CAG8315344.1 unnamed protein product [Penicillium salamii]CAG8342353.1 unnamed protein product [Penicillium salamii]CAG8364693.1 unnamed protein product [Penicillium salamii]CAG8374305.1 unnamed protein product [Penicillium salamii]
MSRHRVKDVGYDDDDYYSDDGYASPDPEEQEFLQQCTTAVLQQLGAGQSPVTATKEEVQEALWHYYNDIEKSVNYLRGMCSLLNNVLTGIPVPAYPAPPSTAAHFSAADFFRDCPWLNVPAHRKADILVEPLYPRLGLLGGAPEGGGKVSKLAALAAARKKKEGATPEASTPPTPQSDRTEVSSPDPRGTTRSLRERLAASGKPTTTPKSSESPGSTNRPTKPVMRSPSLSAQKESTTEAKRPSVPHVPLRVSPTANEPKELEHQQSVPSIRASPSTFASTIVGTTGPTIAEPSHLHSSGTDLLKIYGQNDAEPFDFAAPSPDDVVLNAQNTAKGLKSKAAASKSTGDKKGQSEVAGGMKDLSIEDKVTVKSKNLDVLAEYKKSTRKKSANFVVIGQYIPS